MRKLPILFVGEEWAAENRDNTSWIRYRKPLAFVKKTFGKTELREAIQKLMAEAQ